MKYPGHSKSLRKRDLQSAHHALWFRAIFLLTLAGCLVGPATSFSADTSPPSIPVAADPRLSEFRAELAGRVARGEMASLAIGVLENGKIIWAEALGWSDLKAREPATIDTRYGIASVGKSMVAATLLQLVEQGTLDLDDSLGNLLGQDAIETGRIDESPSLRQLLNMSAGVAHGAYTYTNGITPEPDLAEHRRAVLAFHPGEVFHYSNYSIDLVDQVLQAKTGESLDEILRQRLFRPLGMNSCAFEPSTDFPKPATRYLEDGSEVGMIAVWPSSSRRLHCSLVDLLHYTAFELKTALPGQVRALSTKSIDRMQTERSGLPGAHMALGIGSIDIGNGKRWLITSGQDMGVQASITLVPSKKLGVVVLTNSSGNSADEIGMRAAGVLVPGLSEDLVAAVEEFESHTTPWSAQDDWLGGWTGAIESAEGERTLSLAFQADGDIHVSFDEQYPTMLSEVGFREGLLTGTFLGKLPLEESAPGYHRIELGLVRHGGYIEGFAVANFRNDHGKFELPTRVTLRRDPATSPGQ